LVTGSIRFAGGGIEPLIKGNVMDAID